MNEAEFKSHPIWELLTVVGETISSVYEMVDPTQKVFLNDARGILAYTASFAESPDFFLFSSSMLAQGHGNWGGFQTQMAQFQSNPAGYPNYFDAAIAQLEGVRGTVATWPRPIGSASARDALRRAMNAYRDELDSSRSTIQSKLDAVIADADRREAALEARASELEVLLASNATALDVLDARLLVDETRLGEALTANNEVFIASQTTRDTAFKEWLSTQENSFGKLAAPHLETVREAAVAATAALQEVKALRTSTVEMSSLAAGDILADQYGAYSKSERSASYWAYGIGVGAAIVSILIVLFAFGTIAHTTEWQVVALKISLTAAAGGIAAVAFRFGGGAVRRATSFKRQELELRALQPFLKDVQGADEAKTAFLGRAFGHAWSAETKPGKTEPEVNEALLSLLSTAMQNLPKK